MRWNEMERDGTRWSEMERDGTRWNGLLKVSRKMSEYVGMCRNVPRRSESVRKVKW